MAVWLLAQAGLAESVQTCTLLVTGRLEEVLDPTQKAAKYPAVQPDQLVSMLYKFRCSSLPLLCMRWCSNLVFATGCRRMLLSSCPLRYDAQT